MARSSVIVTLVFVVLFTSAVQCKTGRSRSSVENNRRRNGIPQPKLEALYPKGLRVSVPNVAGMELFAFHGKINSPIDRTESGNISKDVLHSVNGEWVFEDHEVQLHVGDVVNYWVFAQINRMGYRLDNLSTVITELVPVRRQTTQTSSPQLTQQGLSLPHSGESSECRNNQNNHRRRTASSTGCNCDLSELKTISTQLNVTLTQLSSINDVVVPLRSQVESLTELLQELIKDKNIGTQLLLIGQQPPGTNPLEAVRQLVVEKLELIDLEQKILQAHKTKDGILFEVSSPIDKKRILFRTEHRIYNSNYYIIDPQEEDMGYIRRSDQTNIPFIPSSMVRMGGESSSQESTRHTPGNRNRGSYEMKNNQLLQLPNRNDMRSTLKTQSSRNQDSVGRLENSSRNREDLTRRIENHNVVNSQRRNEDTHLEKDRGSSTPEYKGFTEARIYTRPRTGIENEQRRESYSSRENYESRNLQTERSRTSLPEEQQSSYESPNHQAANIRQP